ncbi:MAG: hypothetical protein HYV07_15155 [Deltaproteobacteria bacterium]|nr:hypothetical protein [Deltaproteobacteria bacterium]
MSCLACADGVLAIEPPIEGPAIVALELLDRAPVLWASDDFKDPLEWRVEDGEGKLTFIPLGRSLEASGLAAGSVPLAQAGACGAGPLPPGPDFQLSLAGAASSGWSEGSRRSATLDAARIASRCECLVFSVRSVRPFERRCDQLAEASGHLVIAGGFGLTIVDESGTSTSARSATNAAVLSLYVTPWDDIYLGTSGGLVFRGRIDEPFTLIEAPPVRGGISALDGPHETADLELFALSTRNELVRFDGSSWTSIPFRLDEQPAGSGGQNANVAWLGPGRALVTPIDAGQTLFVDGGDTRAVQNHREISRMFWLEDLGVFAAGRNGGLDRFDGQTWVDYPVSTGTAEIRSVDVTGTGLLVTGESMIGQVIERSHELCAPVELEGVAVIRGLRGLGGLHFVLAQNRSGQEQLMILESRLREGP